MIIRSKEQLRHKLLTQQPYYSNEEATDISEKIQVELCAVIRQTEAKNVLLYQSVKKWNEISVTGLPNLLPSVHFDTIANTKDAKTPTKAYDIVIAPLLGYTTIGYRLGHGGGWYDRFLAAQPQALKIGVGYEKSVVNFQVESHDIAMDLIVTEKRVQDFRDKR